MPRIKRQQHPALPQQARPWLVWFRNDLRLADNPALHRALQEGVPIIPVYVWSPEDEGDWPPGAASRWWLHHSLEAIQSDLHRVGSCLILRRGRSLEVLRQLVAETSARGIFWNRRLEPFARQIELRIGRLFAASGIHTESFNATLLHDPAAVLNSSGRPFQVFSAFWKCCLNSIGPSQLFPTPARIPAPKSWPCSSNLPEFELLPAIDWAAGLRRSWRPGETGAVGLLSRFSKDAFGKYDTNRDRLDLAGTSRLSPHLHFGEISVRRVWNWLKTVSEGSGRDSRLTPASRFCTELGWREFSHYLLYHFPHTVSQPLRESFMRFRWRENPRWLEAWQRGQTGFPIVDAGMRELWATGWMHNRARMVVASFLVKDLLTSWQDGARWFWDTLVDADLAQNTLGWQWCAGCGADAAPFFRIFNPLTQGEKFDPGGAYVRSWVPELSALPDRWVHRPHQAPAEVLRQAGVKLGTDYPEPLVNHAIAREIALESFRKLNKPVTDDLPSDSISGRGKVPRGVRGY